MKISYSPLFKILKQKNLSARKFATLAKLEEGHLSRLRHGKSTMLVNTLVRISLVLDVKYEELFEVVFEEGDEYLKKKG